MIEKLNILVSRYAWQRTKFSEQSQGLKVRHGAGADAPTKPTKFGERF